MGLLLGSEDEIARRARCIAVHEAAHAAHAHFYEPDQVEIDAIVVSPLQPHCSGCTYVLLEDEDAGNASDRAVRALVGDYAVSRLVEDAPRIPPLDAMAHAAGLRESAPEADGFNWDAADVRNAGEALAMAVRGGVFDSFEQAYESAVDLLQARFMEIEGAVLALADACLIDRHLSGAGIRRVLDANKPSTSTLLEPA